jgi:maleate isomerase
MLEHEWPAWLPPGVLFPIARVRLGGATAAHYTALAAAAPEAARDLAAAGCGVIAYACALGSLYAGVESEARLVSTLAAAGPPAIALAETCIAALRTLGTTRLAVLTPYGDKANGWVAAYAESQGFTVEGVVSTTVGIATVGDLPPDAVAALALAGLAAHPRADALWIPCTAVQTIAAIAAIEAASGRPVVSGSQALLWRSLRLAGVDDPVGGAGRLFGYPAPP